MLTAALPARPLTRMNSSAVPGNHVAIMRPSSCHHVAKAADPIVRASATQTTQFLEKKTTSRMARRNGIASSHPEAPLAIHFTRSRPRVPVCGGFRHASAQPASGAVHGRGSSAWVGVADHHRDKMRELRREKKEAGRGWRAPPRDLPVCRKLLGDEWIVPSARPLVRPCMRRR